MKSNPIPPILVFAYGNPSRGDDALGPEFLQHINAQHWPDQTRSELEILTDFQLQVEHATDLAGRELVLFVDANVSCPAPFRFTRIYADKDTSYSSHAVSPAAVLYVFEQIYQTSAPSCFLLSMRGEHFELGAPLSMPARHNLDQAVKFFQALYANPSEATWAPYVYKEGLAAGEAP